MELSLARCSGESSGFESGRCGQTSWHDESRRSASQLQLKSWLRNGVERMRLPVA